mgnify:CR=1 FL=1
MRLDYLKGLNDRYDNWIENYKDGKKLIINVDEIKFEENPKDLSLVIDSINAQLNGLF